MSKLSPTAPYKIYSRLLPTAGRLVVVVVVVAAFAPGSPYIKICQYRKFSKYRLSGTARVATTFNAKKLAPRSFVTFGLKNFPTLLCYYEAQLISTMTCTRK